MPQIPVRHFNSLQKELAVVESFSIRKLETVLAGKAMVEGIHRHDFYYILILEKGGGDHAIDFTTYEVKDNTIFFMRPGQVHKIALRDDAKGYLMQFRPEFYPPDNKASNLLLQKVRRITYYQLDSKVFKRLLNPLGCILDEYADKKDNYEEVIKSNLNVFFIELLRQCSAESSEEPKLYLQQKLEAFLEHLDVHALSHKPVAGYAALMNISVYQLNTITKATLGKTCSALINEHVLLEAKRNLLATADQVNQIAYNLGYEDVSYFIRFF
jgi:AraC family transcriptional activator of pobA